MDPTHRSCIWHAKDTGLEIITVRRFLGAIRLFAIEVSSKPKLPGFLGQCYLGLKSAVFSGTLPIAFLKREFIKIC